LQSRLRRVECWRPGLSAATDEGADFSHERGCAGGSDLRQQHRGVAITDMSEAKGQGHFSDGISEELLNLLTKIPQLKVAARISSFSFKGKQVEIPEIARQLHVAKLLGRSVRKSGDRHRITAQLIPSAVNLLLQL
jgi:TolB-like protein